MPGNGSHGRVRSFLLGGLLGASAALAAGTRRRKPASPRRETPAGLAAFEGAPCYQELLEQEQPQPRERVNG